VKKKTEKPIKLRKQKKKVEKTKPWKKPIKILKKLTGSVSILQAWNQKTRTEPNPEKKPSQTRKTEPNQFEPVFVLKQSNRIEPKPVGLNRFRFFF
jgi:hypothetical protein